MDATIHEILNTFQGRIFQDKSFHRLDMTFKKFPIYRSHLDLTKLYWDLYLKKGFRVIDATCGNGFDSLYVAKKILPHQKAHLYCIDIQNLAINNTTVLLKKNVKPEAFSQISFYNHSFESFPKSSYLCDMIIYNLGYLPRSDKSIKTQKTTTLKSLEKALLWVKQGGIISISCYSGHQEGLIEKTAIEHYLKTIDPKRYTICSYNFLNRLNAPNLIIIQKGY